MYQTKTTFGIYASISFVRLTNEVKFDGDTKTENVKLVYCHFPFTV